MNKKIRHIALIIILSFVISGYTIVDYDEYYEPSWVSWEFKKDGALEGASTIKPKVENAITNINAKGLVMDDFIIFISPYTYTDINGAAQPSFKEALIANNQHTTIYHELGHLYSYEYRGIVEKYQQAMQQHYPNYIPHGSYWEKSISEDFAEEFKKLFTGVPKKTAYPDFPNFYEWLLKSTQPIEITREEVFNKLGGTTKLINNGIVIGNTHGDYMLDRPIKRSELATVLVRLGKGHSPTPPPFTDVKGKWYESYVSQLHLTKIIKGYPDGSFKGERYVTRYELHMILERL